MSIYTTEVVALKNILSIYNFRIMKQMIKQRALPVTLPEGLVNELDKLVHIEGIYLSRSDALRYGARLVLLFARGTNTITELKKEARDKL